MLIGSNVSSVRSFRKLRRKSFRKMKTRRAKYFII